ncbi:MAG: hypothetical protein ABSH19_08995 [Opitutales bacterium]|jgi:hypothetical protein
MLAFTVLPAPLALAVGTVPAVKTPTPPVNDLNPPSNFSATDGQYNTGIRISWDAPPEASYYDLYRGPTTDFSQAKIRAHVRIVRFNDRETTPGVSYYYWIAARAINRTSDIIGPVQGIRGFAPRFQTEPPRLLVANVGSTLSIPVKAEGIPAISFQWYVGKTMLTDGSGISGSQTDTLTLSPLTIADQNDRYFVRIKNATGALNSRFVSVEVIRP